jgi:hypothetical protein
MNERDLAIIAEWAYLVGKTVYESENSSADPAKLSKYT